MGSIGGAKKNCVMKKALFLIAFSLLAGSAAVNGQTAKEQQNVRKEQRKEYKKEQKLSLKELSAKASKTARKEAKRLKKEGWKTSPGALPMEKQLDKSYLMQFEYDDQMYPKYVMGEARSTGENYDGAKMQALELAKQNLVGQIQAELTSLIESSVANSQLAAEEAATVTKTVAASKSLLSQSLGRMVPVVELYRILPNNNKEVLVRLAYSSWQAKEAAKKLLRAELEKEGGALLKKLGGVEGW